MAHSPMSSKEGMKKVWGLYLYLIPCSGLGVPLAMDKNHSPTPIELIHD